MSFLLQTTNNLNFRYDLKNSSIAEVDFLRGIAILYIVAFWHLFEYSPSLSFHKIPVTHLFTNCFLGLFVFISGFLLSLRYDINTFLSVKKFYIKRILRLYPMYLISLTIFWIAQKIELHTYVKSIFLVNTITNDRLLTLWFVSMIFLFYLLTPIFLWSYSKFKVITITILVFIGLIFINSETGYVDIRLPQYLIIFSFGIIVAREDTVKFIIVKKLATLFSLIFLFIFLSLVEINTTNQLSLLFLKLFVILSFIPLLFTITNRIVHLFPLEIILKLSYSSFSMYLIHRFIFKLGVIAFQPETLFISCVYLLGILLPLTILLSYWYQRTYDWLLLKITN